MSHDDDRPVKFTPERLFTLPGALLISVVVLAGGVGIGWANLKAQINEVPALKARVDDLEKDARKVDVIANDVAWIKAEMQRRSASGQGSAPR